MSGIKAMIGVRNNANATVVNSKTATKTHSSPGWARGGNSANPIAASGAKMMMKGIRRPRRVRVLSLMEPIIGWIKKVIIVPRVTMRLTSFAF